MLVRPARRGERGLTLIELLVTVAIIAIVTAAVLFGSGAVVNSRVRRAAALTTGAIRLAYTRASATSRPHRIVFDLDKSRIVIEETSGPMLVNSGEKSSNDKVVDTTGGASGQTQEERDAIAQADQILKGPRAPRPMFHPIQKLYGFDQAEEGGTGKFLGNGVKIRRVETGHTPDGQTEGRAYLYFWPGGETERAAIQLATANAGPDDGMTLLVAPLTGKVKIVSGAKSLPEARDDGSFSEREDRSF